MPIEHHKGDLLAASDVDIIVHGCNCQGVWGAGIAKQIKRKYPYVWHHYRVASGRIYRGMSNKEKLGGYIPVEAYADSNDGPLVINAHTQLYYGRERRHVNYAAIGAIMLKLNEDFDEEDGVIGMPKIGCGLAGGDWSIVSQIIEDAFGDRVVRVYEL